MDKETVSAVFVATSILVSYVTAEVGASGDTEP